jgi:TetR/AcrR family transcriptional regulator of autoinduction and epiphytic fitness
MALRGDALHAHILDTAKSVFLESGFERTSMDVVAARAGTSKRSLYAHFATKEALFSSCVERIHELFDGRLLTPGDYSPDPREAVVTYCGRLLQLFAWASIAQTCRVGITEAERFPEATARIYDTFLGIPAAGLSLHLRDRFGMGFAEADALAERILGATVLPYFSKVLFGCVPSREDIPGADSLATDVDLSAVRATVSAILAH